MYVETVDCAIGTRSRGMIVAAIAVTPHGTVAVSESIAREVDGRTTLPLLHIDLMTVYT